ncbi:MAG TPA: hypothetical protein VFB15_01420 [Candidatus Binataceae bacterium]|nr:hypothetical protein [Candidatus Binataceae bacterium]
MIDLRKAAAVLLGTVICVFAARAYGEVRQAGTLKAPPGAALMPFSTDPVIQQVLRDDIRAAQRWPSAGSTSVLTLTVTVTQQLLKPGVSFEQVAPGDPQVAGLLKQAGATPPPIGDTGSETDYAAVARAQELNGVHVESASPMQEFMDHIKEQATDPSQQPCNGPSDPNGGCAQATPKPALGDPNYTGDVADYLHDTRSGAARDAHAYDTAIVARSSLGGLPDELTVVAVVHPGEDVDDAKKLVGEAIANAVLH